MMCCGMESCVEHSEGNQGRICSGWYWQGQGGLEDLGACKGEVVSRDGFG